MHVFEKIKVKSKRPSVEDTDQARELAVPFLVDPSLGVTGVNKPDACSRGILSS